MLRTMHQLPLVVSEIQIVPVKPAGGLVAFASCVLNSQLYVGDIAIHTRPDGSGFRLVYPAKTLTNGKTINVVHPITPEAGEAIRKTIVAEFQKLMERSR